MPTLLAITVGGSCAPVVTAVRDYAPDFVCFFASAGPRGSRTMVDGKGNVCGEAPSIVAQTGLRPEQYEVVELAEPDSLPDCYGAMRAAMGRLAADRADWRRLADYTGGTKTMSAALVLAALEADWEISLVKGTRPDLVKVLNGSEMAALVNAWEVRARQRMAEARQLFNQYAYASAGELLESLVRSGPLSPELEREVRQWVALCRAFDAWDRFDHAQARRLLEPYQSRVVPQWRFLKALTSPPAPSPLPKLWERGGGTGGGVRASGYEPVLDLVRNAERRAARGRYDDAVARLYRALEMLAQIRLRQRTPPLDTGDLDVSALPEGLRQRYEARRDATDGKVRLGLRQAYDLLAELGDPLGRVWREHEKRVINALKKRNMSILAHGSMPLAQGDYQEMAGVVQMFVEAGLAALGVKLEAPQFPQWEAYV